MEKQVAEFRRIARAVVKRSLQDSPDAVLFKPGAETPDSFIGVGILGRHQTLIFCIGIGQVHADAIPRRPAGVNGKISHKQLGEFLAGGRRLIPHPILARGKVAWDSAFKANMHYDTQRSPWEELFCGESVLGVPETAFYICPTGECRRTQPGKSGAFQRTDLDVNTKCRFCFKHYAVKLRHCECGSLWHSCDVHKHSYSKSFVKPSRVAKFDQASSGCQLNTSRSFLFLPVVFF